MKNPGLISKGKYYKWRVGAFVLVHTTIFLHLYLWYRGDWKVFGSIGMQELFRTFLQTGVLNAGAVFFLFLILMAMVWGRAFCGWACHVGLLYDLLDPWFTRFLPRKRMKFRFGPFVAAFILLQFFVRPAIITRFYDPPDQLIAIDLAQTEPWALLPGWFFGVIILFCVIVVLPLFFGRRAFCKMLCPWGITLGVTNLVSRLKIRKIAPCTFCGKCDYACPMDIDVSATINTYSRISSPSCTGCLYCVEACAEGTLGFTLKNNEFGGTPPTSPAKLPLRTGNNLETGQTKRYYPLTVELFFWFQTIVVGMVYGEIYGIGHFLAFSMGLIIAQISLVCGSVVLRQKAHLKLGNIFFLLLVWAVILKDGSAHYHYKQGLALFHKQDWPQSQVHLEKSDSLFWSPPTELFLKLYTIYKSTDQREKQEAIRTRYDARREAARKRSVK